MTRWAALIGAAGLLLACSGDDDAGSTGSAGSSGSAGSAAGGSGASGSSGVAATGGVGPGTDGSNVLALCDSAACACEDG